jgi:octaprenyl-diphosphate synthase
MTTLAAHPSHDRIGSSSDGRAVLDRLAAVSTMRGAKALAERLADLDRWVRADLAEFSHELDAIPRGARVVHRAAHHLLDLRGKHLRPLCVALASRFGDGFTESARSLAVAVELVHSATLLHDDVVDLAERRRGQPTASVVYGNAASIFAGDWLLIAALRRIRQSGVEGVLDRMLAVIDEMIAAESVQLERRGVISGAREDYFAIIEGKTAALFRWAMIAGARSAGLTAAAEAALERYGFHLGVAFQAVDDELDYRDKSDERRTRSSAEGDAKVSDSTGKDPLADLREGKVTFPLVVAIERDASLRPRLEALLASGDGADIPADELATIANAVRASGALSATRTLAEEHVQRALIALDELPAGAAHDALVTVALASLERQS